MSEEAIADSGTEAVESTEPTDSGIDMDSALDTMSNDLFPNSEPEEAEYEEDEPVEIPEDEPGELEINEEEAPEPIAAKAPPQSWKKDMHEKFSALEPEVQDYIELRESQMREGLELNKEDSTLGRSMRDALQPFKPMLDHIEQQNGATAPQVLQFMLNAHHKLSSGTPEAKQAAFQQMAQEYGVTLGPAQEGQEVDPVVQNMQNELNSLKGHIQANEKKVHDAEVSKVNKSITAFAEDPAHPYFDEVSDQIVAFINSGDDLEGAYEKAVWANPVTRQKEMERVQQDKAAKEAEKNKQEVSKAKKASKTNVRGRNTKKAPTASNGTMEDTMRETFKDIQSRSH